MTDLNRENFDSFINDENNLVLVDFWAPWCGPCRMMGPVVEGLEGKVSNLKLGKVNVDDNEELAIKFRVDAIPYIALFKNGKLVDSSLGYVQEDRLISMIEKNR